LQTTVTGNAGTATKLATARAINVSGDVTGTAQNFDGSTAVTIPTTLKSIISSANVGETANKTLSFGNSFIVPYISVDTAGRITTITGRTLTLPSAPSSISLSSTTPSSPSSSGSAGSGSSASRYDHSHPLQTVVNTVTNQYSSGNAIKLWAGSASSLPSSKNSDTIYFSY
jgi:hypothetical protein